MKPRLSWFRQFQKEGNLALRQFCRMRCKLMEFSLLSLSSNITTIVLFCFMLLFHEDSDPGAKVNGYRKKLQNFNFYFMLRLMLFIVLLAFDAEELILKAVKQHHWLCHDFSCYRSNATTNAKEIIEVGDPSIMKSQVKLHYHENSCWCAFHALEDFYS